MVLTWFKKCAYMTRKSAKNTGESPMCVKLNSISFYSKTVTQNTTIIYRNVNLAMTTYHFIYCTIRSKPSNNTVDLFCHKHVTWIESEYRVTPRKSCLFASWRSHNMETLSVLLALCEGNPSVIGEFLSPGANKAELWWLSWCTTEHTVEQTVELPG